MQTAQQLADKAMSEYFMQHNYRAMYEYYQTHIRSMLTQQQQAAPIKLGDRSLTQEEFNRMYMHYSELCDKEDTNGWWENQYIMADRERNELKAQQQQQREWISVLEKKEFCLWDDEEVTMLTREEHQAIIALLSQKQQQRSYSEEDMYEAYKAEHPLRIYDSMKRQLFNKWLTKYNNLPK